MGFREEKDALGMVRIPQDAYFGPQTQRAVDNFPIGSLQFPLPAIRALVLIKRIAAGVNLQLGLLKADWAEAIAKAATEALEGRFDEQFVVSVFQTGSGTSSNMNVNEVLSGRANEILTGKKSHKAPVHPNDHVNLGQSSNDVIPTAIHVAALVELKESLAPALQGLHQALAEKAEAFDAIAKIGRTHLQDAVPMTLGQEFSGYARQIELARRRVGGLAEELCELALGGTAVGTGLNAHPEFAPRTIAEISKTTGIDFREAQNHFAAQAAQDAVVQASATLKTVAVSLSKIANDIRWLASGPRCGLGEINLPALQPGSSIMPGKVNPVIPEAVLQVAAQVIGNDAAVAVGGQGGIFELNVMLPVIAHNLLQSIELLTAAARVFSSKCVDGITANRETCEGYIEKSLALVTGLVPKIGYDQAAAIAKKAHDTGLTIRQILLQDNVLTEEQISALFNFHANRR
jgi:fumarate hydratase class II